MPSILVFLLLLQALIIMLGSGKWLLTVLADLPVVGVLFAWCMNLVDPMLRPLGDGLLANLAYGVVVLQLILLALASVFWSPLLLRKGLRPVAGWALDALDRAHSGRKTKS
jgi:hypothetical protein